MEKKIALLCLSFLFTVFLYSQNIQYECKVENSHDASGLVASITVTVTSGTPKFIYYLTTNNPIRGEILMKSEPTKKSSYTFKGVKPGKYFIKIEDSSGEQAGKTVIINENEN
jgi:hypothetical protein